MAAALSENPTTVFEAAPESIWGRNPVLHSWFTSQTAAPSDD